MADNIKTACTDPKSSQARTMLKGLSVGAGFFLVLAGIVGGILTPMQGGGFIYFVGAVYAVIFGVVVLTVEIKDKTKPIARFYQWIDKYLKFLTLQRGKGAFYLGVGLLVVFMSPTTSTVGINNIAAIFLAVVGFLHTCARATATACPDGCRSRPRVPTVPLHLTLRRSRVIKESGPPLSASDAGGATSAMQSASADGLDFSNPISLPR